MFCLLPLINSTAIINQFEKKDLPFDVRFDIRVSTRNNRTIPLYSHRGVLPILLFNYLDIRSFSLYERTDDPEHLYASMVVNKFQFSEYRSCYALYWNYKGIHYYVGTNTHTLGDLVSSICGYYELCGKNYNYQIQGEILEEENTITWVIPKELIGDPNSGDTIQDLYASSYLIYQKDCDAPMKLNLASDRAGPLIGTGYSYTFEL
jgi:hypothetical protein